MINLLIGVIVGVIVTSVGFDVIQSTDRNITIQAITNIVIALATVTAVSVNYLSIKSQKDGRRWEVNKDVLIKVSTTLSDLMSQTSKLSDNEFNDEQGIPEEHKFTPDNSIYKKFEQYLDHVIDVYGLVLNAETISAVEKYRKTNSNISHSVDIGEFGLFKAYDNSYAAQRELLKVLNKNIKKYANI